MSAKYRKIKPLEVVLASDEFTAFEDDCVDMPPCYHKGSGGWVHCGADVIGKRVCDTGIGGQFRRAVKLPAKKPKAKKAKRATRRELDGSRHARIASAYQALSRTNISAFDFAAEIERIIDNHRRAKRRKAGK